MKRLLFIVSALLLLAVVSAEAKPKKLTSTITWELQKDGTLIIKGTGEMPKFKSYKDAPWSSVRKKIKNIIIGEGVTHINENCFTGHAKFTGWNERNIDVKVIGEYNIISLSLPSTLVYVDDGAFYQCNIDTLYIAEGVSEISDGAFNFCDIKYLHLPSSLKHIGKGAFRGNDITTLNLPNGVTTIGDEAFKENEITFLTLPEGVAIGKGAFMNNSITKLLLPTTLKVIAEETFYGNDMETLTIPEGITHIEDSAFESCPIKELKLPKTLRHIGERAFYRSGKGNLLQLWLPENLESIGDMAFCSHLNSNSFLYVPKGVKSIGKNAFLEVISLYSGIQYHFGGQILCLPDFITIKNCREIGISERAFRSCKPSSADCYYKAEECSDEKTAFEYYLKGIEAWDENDCKKKCCTKVGDYYWKTEGRLQTALQFYEKAKELGADCDSTIECIKNDIEKKDLKDKADTALKNRQFDLAWDYYAQYHRKYYESSICKILPDYFIGQKDYTNAIKYYKKLYELSKELSTANEIAELYLKINNYSEAIEWYKKGDKSNKEIAELYLKKNNYSGAIEMLSKDAEKGDKDCQYMLAEVYKKSGNKNKAIFWYKKAAEQKHIKAEEALADYGIFLTQQQEKKVNSTPTPSPTPSPAPTPAPEIVREWVPCVGCGGTGKCPYCSGIGYQNGPLGWSKCVICNGRMHCTICWGKCGEYQQKGTW